MKERGVLHKISARNIYICLLINWHCNLQYRAHSQPQHLIPGYRRSDQAKSFRPLDSVYDRDCGVIIDDFDHTCPWTGTGIGGKNMPFFVSNVQ